MFKLKIKLLILLAIVALAWTKTASAQTGTFAPGTVSSDTGTVIALVNAERAKVGLSPLTSNARLAQAALRHANDLKRTGRFSHTGSDGSGVDKRVEAAGYTWSAVGENIAKGQTSARQVMTDWMNSPGHRGNILNGKFTEIGVARVGNIWVQVFAAPR